MQTNTTNVDLHVRVNGNNVATYNHEGKTFVEGRPDTEYALHIQNRNPHRVKVVLSIDQVNVISGKPATDAQDETGYILDKGESQTILGYRLDDNAVARFRFTKAEGSYAQVDKGLRGTTGVIGCRVWKERTPPPAPVVKEVHHYHDHWRNGWNEYPWWHQYPRSPIWYWGGEITCTSSPLASFTTSSAGAFQLKGDATQGGMTFACSNNAPAADNAVRMMNASAQTLQSDLPVTDSNPFELGSTFGTKAESKVTSTTFEVDYCLGQVEVFYTTREGLIALGVDITRKPKVAFPSAFAGQYATPPSGWKG